MCREVITIALCAPVKPPALTFTCGKLHMIAAQRVNCSDAYDKCICYFGTCGSIDKELSTAAIDLSDIEKFRCAGCTDREDAVGDRRQGREILESPILQRVAVSFRDAEARNKHLSALKTLWGNDMACPYHNTGNTVQNSGSASPGQSTELPVNECISPSDQDVATADNSQDYGAGTNEEPSSMDAWTNKPSEQVPSIPEQDTTDTPAMNLEHEDEYDPVTQPDGMSQTSASEPLKEVVNGLESTGGLQSSRWAADTPSEKVVKAVVHPERPQIPVATPKITPRTRHAAKKLTGARDFLTSRK